MVIRRGSAAGCSNYGKVVLEQRLERSSRELKPGFYATALGDALHKFTRLEGRGDVDA